MPTRRLTSDTALEIKLTGTAARLIDAGLPWREIVEQLRELADGRTDLLALGAGGHLPRVACSTTAGRVEETQSKGNLMNPNKDNVDRDGEESAGGSGGGGPTGTPSSDLDEAPPGTDQEANSVVSGGGLIGSEDDEEPSDKASS